MFAAVILPEHVVLQQNHDKLSDVAVFFVMSVNIHTALPVVCGGLFGNEEYGSSK